jgi:hypothetical protein
MLSFMPTSRPAAAASAIVSSGIGNIIINIIGIGIGIMASIGKHGDGAGARCLAIAIARTEKKVRTPDFHFLIVVTPRTQRCIQE